MRPAFRLFLVMGQAALIVTATYCALILVAVWPLAPHVSVGVQVTAGAVGVLAKICFAAWWIFRKLGAYYERREARAAAITFGLFTPVPLGIGLLLGPIVGGYTGIFLGTESRLIAFSGAVMGIVVMIALMTFVPSLLVRHFQRSCARRSAHESRRRSSVTHPRLRLRQNEISEFQARLSEERHRDCCARFELGPAKLCRVHGASACAGGKVRRHGQPPVCLRNPHGYRRLVE
jgi:hypothetical protein